MIVAKNVHCIIFARIECIWCNSFRQFLVQTLLTSNKLRIIVYKWLNLIEPFSRGLILCQREYGLLWKWPIFEHYIELIMAVRIFCFQRKNFHWIKSNSEPISVVFLRKETANSCDIIHSNEPRTIYIMNKNPKQIFEYHEENNRTWTQFDSLTV